MPKTWTPDWMKVVRLPWVTVVAYRWGFSTLWHIGPFRRWIMWPPHE